MTLLAIFGCISFGATVVLFLIYNPKCFSSGGRMG